MNASIKVKGIPKGFSFPITRKKLRELIRSMDAHFTSIVMEGISMSEQFKTKSLSFITDRHVGIITAIRDGEGFTFWLEINALRDEDVVPWRDSVEACLSNQISEWVQKKQELPETAPQEPSQLFLGFDIEKGKCISACHEVSRK